MENAGVASVQDVVALNHADLSMLQHATSPTDDTLVNLSLGGRGMIVAVICMNMNANNDHGNGLSLDDWVTVAKEEFDKSCISNLFAVNPNSFTNPGSARPIPRATTSSTPRNRDSAYDYEQAIKHDQSAFREFKNDKVWDSWNRGFRVQIKAQALHEVINESCTPMTAEETAICNTKKDSYALC